ncbi:hypothetical protein Tco_0010620 [Tanacetum coccineum]
MCLVRECCTGLHEIVMADYNTTYSASAVDIAVKSCFLDIQLTNLSPNNCIPPEVLLRISRHRAWSAFEKAIRSRPESFGY